MINDDETYTPLVHSELEPHQKAKPKSRACCADFSVIVNYITAEQNKKSGSFKIGIFTVFLTVSVITLLQSVMAITPILFV